MKDEKIKRLEALEAEFKKLKDELSEPVFEVGKWYKYDGHLFNYQQGYNVYGFDGDKWIGNNWKWDKYFDGLIPATESEVFEALKKEAIKRGFKGGIRVKCAMDNGEWTLRQDFSEDCFSFYNNTITDGSGAYWFWKGKWAEIISDPFKICGYEVKEYGSDYKIGCKTIIHDDIVHLVRLMNSLDVKSAQLGEYKVTLEEINKLLEL